MCIPPGRSDAVTALGMSTPPEGLQRRVPWVTVGPGWPIAVLGVWRQWLRKGHSKCVFPASCQLSQGLGAFRTAHFSALRIQSSWDRAAVSLQWCSWAFTLVPVPGVPGWAWTVQVNAPTRNGFNVSALNFLFPVVDRWIISDRNRLWGEQEPDVDPAEAAAARHGPVPGGAAHLHPGATLVP